MPRPKGTPKTGGRKPGSLNGACVAKAAQKVEFIRASVERVLQEYQHIAFLDIRHAFTPEGDLKSIETLPDSIAHSVAGIDFEEVFEMQGSGEDRERVHVGRIHKIKLVNKTPALDAIAKHLGMFVDLIKSENTNRLEGEITISLIPAKDGRRAE